jgi:hypothetical protein
MRRRPTPRVVAPQLTCYYAAFRVVRVDDGRVRSWAPDDPDPPAGAGVQALITDGRRVARSGASQAITIELWWRTFTSRGWSSEPANSGFRTDQRYMRMFRCAAPPTPCTSLQVATGTRSRSTCSNRLPSRSSLVRSLSAPAHHGRSLASGEEGAGPQKQENRTKETDFQPAPGAVSVTDSLARGMRLAAREMPFPWSCGRGRPAICPSSPGGLAAYSPPLSQSSRCRHRRCPRLLHRLSSGRW